MIVGYARTSTPEQVAGLECQINDLNSVGCEKIYQEQVSSVQKRCELRRCLDFCREGDIFVVTKIDRLARSAKDLMEIIEELDKKKVSVKILNIGMDTTTATGKLILTILGSIAQFEREMMLERQLEGIAKAQREGKYRGRRPLSKEVKDQVLEMVADGRGKRSIAHELKISEVSIYRIINRVRENGGI